MLEHWKIPSGSSVLEIGCGQGEFTSCLADAVGPAGRVVAVDPAPAGWGTPCMIESQKYLAVSPIGSRITFTNDTAPNYVHPSDRARHGSIMSLEPLCVIL
ncbi:hypothetical protein J3F84DRAFT_391391 [Trichoderma pleuroticola]